jgi:hypothetical protein
LRLAYLTVTNSFAVLRLLPMSGRGEDTQILALRHQIAVLERQLGKEKVGSAAALNLLRLHAWWNGHALDRTRTTHLARLELRLAA